MTSYGLTHFKQMVRVWKTKSLLFCLRDDPLIVFRRQNHVTFIFIKTMSHDLLVQVAYPSQVSWFKCEVLLVGRALAPSTIARFNYSNGKWNLSTNFQDFSDPSLLANKIGKESLALLIMIKHFWFFVCQGRDKVPAYWLGAFFNPRRFLSIIKQVLGNRSSSFN